MVIWDSFSDNYNLHNSLKMLSECAFVLSAKSTGNGTRATLT